MNAYVVRDILQSAALLSAVGYTRQVLAGFAAITDEGHRCYPPTMRTEQPFASDGVTIYYRAARENSIDDVQDISMIVYTTIIRPLLDAGVPVSSWTWERVTDDAITRHETMGSTVGYDGPLLRISVAFAET